MTKSFAFIVIWLVIFIVRWQTAYQTEAKLGQLVGEQIYLSGRISSESILQGSSQRFKVSRIDIVTGDEPKYEYGQKIAVSGILQRQLINKWHSHFSLIYPTIKIIEAEKRNSIRYWILRFRQGIEARFNKNLPEPEASLLAGIVLGVKKGLPPDFYEALRQTGTMHIVVASGYNVTVIIGTIVVYLAGRIKRQMAILLGIMAVAIFSIMAGGQAAIVRAAIMGSLAYFGQLSGRKTEGKRLLLIAVMVMLAVEPLLIFDLGFQLSVAATAGLIWLGPIMEKIFGKIWLVGKDLSETTAAQIAVMPIILTVFGKMSPFSIVVNSLILWLVPIIMSLGAFLAVTGNRLAAWLVYVPLTMMVRIIEWFAKI